MVDAAVDQIQPTTISDLFLVQRKVIRDSRGAVLHMIRQDSGFFSGKFGEIYFSKVKSGVTKGWKYHREISQNFVVPVGAIEFEFFDTREDSTSQGSTFKVTLSEENYQLLIVPRRIWYAFHGVSSAEALIANLASQPHRAEESETRLYTGNPSIDLGLSLE